MSNVKNKKLYEQVKDEIYKKYPTHSAYRSALLVKEYKARGGQYEGRKNKDEGLSRWLRETWRSDKGSVGYDHKNSVYRPTIRINKDTPTTFNELSKKQIERAKREKARTGRVKRFDK